VIVGAALVALLTASATRIGGTGLMGDIDEGGFASPRCWPQLRGKPGIGCCRG
jgi:hypothetical protein